MKCTFTPFQVILTSLSCTILLGCMVGDAFILAFDRGFVNNRLIIINLIVSILTLILTIIFIFRTDLFNMYNSVNSEILNTAPAQRALRTYFCMLSFDAAGVLSIMLIGGILYKNFSVQIVIFSTLIFFTAALIYFVRVSRIGLVDFSDDKGDND